MYGSSRDVEFVFRDLLRANVDITLFKRIVKVTFILYGTNADYERVLSEINQCWIDVKAQMQVYTVEALMKVRNNIDQTCLEFFEIIKNDVTLLENFCSSEKYDPKSSPPVGVEWMYCNKIVRL